MYETEWFEGRRLEKLHERCFWRRIGFSIFLALAAALLLFPMMTGCSSQPQDEEPQICFMKSLGRTPDGMFVVAQKCMTQDDFKESQK